MKLNVKDTKKMLSIKGKLLEFQDGKLQGFTPYAAKEAIEVYCSIVNDLSRQGQTICLEVKNLFVKYGFIARPDGIGWSITIN